MTMDADRTMTVEVLGMRGEVLIRDVIPVDKLGRRRRPIRLQADRDCIATAVRITHPDLGEFRHPLGAEVTPVADGSMVMVDWPTFSEP